MYLLVFSWMYFTIQRATCDIFTRFSRTLIHFYMLIVSAFWSDVQRGAVFARAIEECALPAHYNIWQDRIISYRVTKITWNNDTDIKFVNISSERRYWIGTEHFSQALFLKLHLSQMIWQWQQLSCSFKISLASEKHLELLFLLMSLQSGCTPMPYHRCFITGRHYSVWFSFWIGLWSGVFWKMRFNVKLSRIFFL